MLTHFKSIPTAHLQKKDYIKCFILKSQRKNLQDDLDIENQKLKTHKVTALKLWFRLFDIIVHRKNASRVPSSRAICSLSVLCAPGRFCGLARDSLPVALMMNQ